MIESPNKGMTTVDIPADSRPWSQLTRCDRCGGFMTREWCVDFLSDSGEAACVVHRCIQCGELLDDVILRNRLIPHPQLQSCRRW